MYIKFIINKFSIKKNMKKSMESNRRSFEETNALIEIRHEETIRNDFEKYDGNPNKQNKIWDMITNQTNNAFPNRRFKRKKHKI